MALSLLVQSDCAIVGGGLAGLVAARRLEQLGIAAVLFDRGLPQSGGRLGGFAKFSGAKFSLLPAGQGLIPVAGSEDELQSVIEKVLSMLGLNKADAKGSATLDRGPSASSLSLRSYSSIVLRPPEMDELISRLQLGMSSTLVQRSVQRIERAASDVFVVHDEQGERYEFGSILYAGGRNANHILESLGAKQRAGKGVDLGFRIEFEHLAGLAGLRALGPDAKILLGTARTFCLNVPGTIFRYPSGPFTIPGGVVADEGVTSANVGLLVRLPDKQRVLEEVTGRLHPLTRDQIEAAPIIRGAGFGGQQELFRKIYGEPVTEALSEFLSLLGREELIDIKLPHRLHFPLLDWHWPTYGGTGSSCTSEDRVYVAGDSAGHARGLLQAAVSGWLAAEEIARANHALL